MTAVTLSHRLFALPAIAGAALLVSVSLLGAHKAQAQETELQCQPEIKTARTEFPYAARRSAVHGSVVVKLHIDADGKARDAAVAESSGHAGLDRAAVDSVRRYWAFDIAKCSASELHREHTVRVEFVRAKRATVYGTRDARAIAHANVLRTDRQCHASKVDASETVFSCVHTAAQLADKDATAKPHLQATR